MSPSPWLRKPLWVVHLQEEEDLQASSTSTSTDTNTSTSTSIDVDRSSRGNKIERHLTLFDLISVGVGGTIGSGIFVLAGFIAHTSAGPAALLSFALAGVAACCSGIGYAELAGRLPSSGSTYVYTYVAMGELPAVLSFACMTLEYALAGSAVARSWGDKMVIWCTDDLQLHFLADFIQPRYGINPMAGIISALSTFLLWNGVKESKRVTNIFSILKVALVIFMIIVGLYHLNTANLKPFIPMGFPGVMRGATSSFFAFLGYDEVCVVAGEALHPQRDMPRAVLSTLAIVTILYMTATIALTGMQPYTLIDETSAFPKAFRHNGANLAAQISAAGEIITLPVVVLLSLMAQPRLQQALVRDGLLPEIFGKVDQTGNLRSGVLISGIAMTIVATFVPFKYLDDLISTGILVAFSMTNASLILLRCESPTNRPNLLSTYLGIYNVLCFITGLLLCKVGSVFLSVLFSAITFGFGCYMSKQCPRGTSFGGSIFKQQQQQQQQQTSMMITDDTLGLSPHDDDHDHYEHNHHHHHHEQPSTGRSSQFFETPFVPLIPCFGTFVNWYLIAQLEWSGLLMLLVYLGLTTVIYFSCGAARTSFDGWKRNVGADGICLQPKMNSDENDDLLRSISLTKTDPVVTTRRTGVAAASGKSGE